MKLYLNSGLIALIWSYYSLSRNFLFQAHFFVTALFTFCYPVVPTLTFIAVFWVKGGQNDEKKDKRIVVLGEDEENMTKM